MPERLGAARALAFSVLPVDKLTIYTFLQFGHEQETLPVASRLAKTLPFLQCGQTYSEDNSNSIRTPRYFYDFLAEGDSTA